MIKMEMKSDELQSAANSVFCLVDSLAKAKTSVLILLRRWQRKVCCDHINSEYGSVIDR